MALAIVRLNKTLTMIDRYSSRMALMTDFAASAHCTASTYMSHASSQYGVLKRESFEDGARKVFYSPYGLDFDGVHGV